MNPSDELKKIADDLEKKAAGVTKGDMLKAVEAVNILRSVASKINPEAIDWLADVGRDLDEVGALAFALNSRIGEGQSADEIAEDCADMIENFGK